MGTPSDRDRSGRDREDEGDEGRLYDGDEREYAGFAVSDDQLDNQPDWVADDPQMSVEEWDNREPGARDKVLMRIFGEDAELPVSLGSGVVRWIVIRMVVFLLLVALISALVSTVGWGSLFAGFLDFQAETGPDSSGALANASESAGGIAANVSRAQSSAQAQYRGVTVVNVSRGSVFTVTPNGSSRSRSIYIVQTIGAVSPPPSGTLDMPNPTLYGLENTSENRSCLSRWGDRGTNYTRSLIDGKNVTVVSSMSQTGSNGSVRQGSGTPYYVVRNNTSVSAGLLRQGLARMPDSEFPNRENFSAFRDRARANGSGVWGCPVGPNESG